MIFFVDFEIMQPKMTSLDPFSHSVSTIIFIGQSKISFIFVLGPFEVGVDNKSKLAQSQ